MKILQIGMIAMLLSLHCFTLQASDCKTTLRELNKYENGIPSSHIDEYENCIKTCRVNDANDRELLKICYRKLIQYYNLRDDVEKVDFYEQKLNAIK